MVKICSVEECKRPVISKELCTLHYQRVARYGMINPPRKKRVKKEPKLCSVEGCGNKYYGHNLCQKHYLRVWKHGTTELDCTERGEPIKFLLNSLTIDTDDCILWPFHTHDNGYGWIRYKGKSQNAHRVVLILSEGEPSDKTLLACHSRKCISRRCINKKHLRFDTPKGNTSDAIAIGTFVVGEDHKLSKLSEKDIINIRTECGTQKEIAKMYGVDTSNISYIINRKTWKHVP